MQHSCAKDTYIAELKAKLEHESENLTYKIEKAISEKEKEIYELKTNIQTKKIHTVKKNVCLLRSIKMN